MIEGALSRPHQRKLIPRELTQMRLWAADHGKKFRQNTTRNTSTKDKPGTLPINIYNNYKEPEVEPVCFKSLMEGERVKEVETGKDTFLVVSDNSGSFVLAAVNIDIKDVDKVNEIDSIQYRSTGESCFDFERSGNYKLSTSQIVIALENEHIDLIQEDIVSLTEKGYLEIRQLVNDKGPQEIEDESSDESSDEESVTLYSTSYVVKTRGGRAIKFNSKYNDFVF